MDKTENKGVEFFEDGDIDLITRISIGYNERAEDSVEKSIDVYDMIYKGKAPIGYISRRADGNYKKVSATGDRNKDWELIAKNPNYQGKTKEDKPKEEPKKPDEVPTPAEVKADIPKVDIPEVETYKAKPYSAQGVKVQGITTDELHSYEKELKEKAEKEGKVAGTNAHHWGSATSDNEMGKMVAFSSGSEYRPVDKINDKGEFTRHEYELTAEQAKKAVELRLHAQEQLKKFPKEDHPHLYRGMMLTEDNLKELASSGTIDMTGCSSLTFSNKVAEKYSLNPTSSAPTSDKKRIACKVIIKRDDDVDGTIGAWHRDSSGKDESKPPYEVISGVPRLKADKIIFEKGMTPAEAIKKAKESGDEKKAKIIEKSEELVSALKSAGIDIATNDSLRGATAVFFNAVKSNPEGFAGHVKAMSNKNEIDKLGRYDKQATRKILENKDAMEKAYNSFKDGNPSDSKFPVVEALKTWKETNVPDRYVVHASMEKKEKGYAVGAIVQREDGQYQKQSDGSWKKLPEPDNDKKAEGIKAELKSKDQEGFNKLLEKTMKGKTSIYDGVKPEHIHEYSGETKKNIDNMLDTPIGNSGMTYRNLAEKFKEKGHNMMVVGGAIRDIVQGKEGKDVDFIVDCTPKEIKSVLNEINPKWLAKENKPVFNSKIGLVSYKDGKEEVDITPVHNESKGKATMKSDLESRDFKMNAVHLDPINQVLVDSSGKGIDNTLSGKLEFCSESPSDRNLLRSFKFLSRGNEMTDESKAILKDNFYKIDAMSQQNKDTFLNRQVYNKDGIEGVNKFKEQYNKYAPEGSFDKNFGQKFNGLQDKDRENR